MQLGVHSEVGKLRTVMVCRPGLAHQRLTPGNCHDLLFDDVIWVHEAQKDHYDFVLKMQERGVEVLDLHDLLAETLDRPEARGCVLDRRITAEPRRRRIAAGSSAPGSTSCPRQAGASTSSAASRSATCRRASHGAMLTEAFGGTDFIMPPCPTRCSSATRPAGSTAASPCNPMYWPARKPETLLQRAVYKFHPRFKGGDFKIWWGDSDEDFGAATMEGGDVMPIGKGVVLIGMGERTTRQAVLPGRAQPVRRQGAPSA